ncbi:TIGR04086 family membrane protein [Caldinitratiruptor microaerophilus]|uniref:TIGR04086 family membrane protein n=1 Tax=Caldinitratiruptor microaerophilus TaxID=671077 RepID=A0AA35CIW1_9FIRM|nr:TIGR04086 family membrane protein [Caldinitratiruptor microaerophilus]BDG60059.1 hypothetical protein caldi_11490 [Caldinitratiruptor microaerophilus]
MQRSESATGGVAGRAIWDGLVTGLTVMAVCALVLALVAWRLPVTPRTLQVLGVAAQLIGGLAAGFLSGRRAGAAGLVNGLLTGVGLAVLLTLLGGVAASFPAVGALLRRAALLAGVGALGGVAGVATR